jgi:hypothetical protein
MKPIGLRFKNDGELMIVHKCLSCGKISSNRIAGDDFTDSMLSLVLQEDNKNNLLTIKDIKEIHNALFGRK